MSLTNFAKATPVQLAFDVNDVSFLLPLSKGKPYPVIPAFAEPKLISESLLKQILLFESPGQEPGDLGYPDSNFTTDPKQWFVTSIRFDDCGDSFEPAAFQNPNNGENLILLAQGSSCQARLRLVIQPFNVSGQPLRSAIHLIYNLGLVATEKMVSGLSEFKALANIKAQTSGLPLMPHPALVAEIRPPDSGTAVGDALRSLLLDVLSGGFDASEAHLEIATVTLNVSLFQWRMTGGYIQNGKWTRFVTAFNKAFYDPTGEEQISLGVEQFHCNFYSYCASKPNKVQLPNHEKISMTYLYRENSDGTLPAPVRNHETELMAEQIDNPAKTHFFNSNCISCHQSSNNRNRLGLLTDLGSPLKITPFTLRNYVVDKNMNIINFGYEGTSVRISTRTASESAVVANRLNQARGLENPGFVPQSLTELWACLMSNSNYLSCLH
jgi:hypothetical protein